MKRSTDSFSRTRETGRRRSDSATALFILAAAGLVSCSVDSTKSRFLMAERLWEERDYKAAVSEFERVAARDKYGVLGKRAALRAAITQGLFLQQYSAAVKKLRDFIETEGDTPESWEARRTIGAILFEREQNYDQALSHYQEMLTLRPKDPEAAMYRERIADSLLNLSQFDEAFEAFETISKEESGSARGERAALKLGQILSTQGEQRPPRRLAETPKSVYREAIRYFEAFLAAYPTSRQASEARFGIASCLADLDQLDQAEAMLESIRSTYPSPGVILVKLARIRERKVNQGAARNKRLLDRPAQPHGAEQESGE